MSAYLMVYESPEMYYKCILEHELELEHELLLEHELELEHFVVR